MARRGKNGRKNQSRRVPSIPNTRTPLHRLLPRPVLTPLPLVSSLPDWHPPQRDHRRVHKSRQLPVTFSGTTSHRRPAKSRVPSPYPSSQLQISVPQRSFICARRKIRREVIFAIGRSGRGNSRPRFNSRSDYRC